MSNKLFVLGWDNVLVSDVAENIHASYLSMLENFICILLPAGH